MKVQKLKWWSSASKIGSFADSLNATNWSKIWIQPIESLSNFIFDKKNDQKKKYFIIQHAFRYSPQKTVIVSCKILICINWENSQNVSFLIKQVFSNNPIWLPLCIMPIVYLHYPENIVYKQSRVKYCRHLIPPAIKRMSASAWLYKHPWITCQKVSQGHHWPT